MIRRVIESLCGVCRTRAEQSRAVREAWGAKGEGAGRGQAMQIYLNYRQSSVQQAQDIGVAKVGGSHDRSCNYVGDRCRLHELLGTRVIGKQRGMPSTLTVSTATRLPPSVEAQRLWPAYDSAYRPQGEESCVVLSFCSCKSAPFQFFGSLLSRNCLL